jgi:hypothetical protein
MTRAIQRELDVAAEVRGDARDMIEFAPSVAVVDNGGQHRAAISLLVGGGAWKRGPSPLMRYYTGTVSV